MAANNDPTLASVASYILNESLISVIHSLVLDIHTSETAILRSCDPKTLLPLCPSCSLPRLLEPPLSISRPDKSTQYCSHVPWSRKAGHDIYANPFPVAGSDKPPTKKEREARALQAKKEKAGGKDGGTPDKKAGDQDEDDGPNIAGGPVDKKAAKVGERLKDGRYVPWHTCPSCKRSLLITRFAQHLEKCLGIGGRGRAAARNGGNGTGSQGSGAGQGSRGVTPVGKDRARDDSSGSEMEGKDVRKKVLKKGLGKLKKAGEEKEGKLKSVGKEKKEDGAKREREEDDEDTTPLRKKQKLQRQLSTASVGTTGSASVDNDASVVGDESVDGSFVHNDEEEASEED
ncbi:hypothetical protein CAC42_1990 [Sphaceloma murrayae]|uniref:SAGA-associated factor 11 n=1 Tax=Sphaceloma murrayae TaxID=2082308 RepID=A0A2K1QII2_9PEZI|nr:hypothetical protein CAC42_1990 [Sphaceloma murrayae]